MSVVVDDVVQSVAEVSVPPAPAESLWRLSVEQYHDMARQGILVDGDPVELLEGLLVKKMTISPSHRLATRLVRVALERVVPPGFYVDAPSPVTLQRSEPEPDVVLVRGTDRDYSQRHPGPADLPLIVEVADSSLRRDQGFKKVIYAKASIPVYWIVNLIDRCVEVYSDPTGASERPDYRLRKDFSETGQVPLVIEGREVAQIPVRDILA
jgi:Uma2 family endonuclease